MSPDTPEQRKAKQAKKAPQAADPAPQTEQERLDALLARKASDTKDSAKKSSPPPPSAVDLEALRGRALSSRTTPAPDASRPPTAGAPPPAGQTPRGPIRTSAPRPGAAAAPGSKAPASSTTPPGEPGAAPGSKSAAPQVKPEPSKDLKAAAAPAPTSEPTKTPSPKSDADPDAKGETEPTSPEPEADAKPQGASEEAPESAELESEAESEAAERGEYGTRRAKVGEKIERGLKAVDSQDAESVIQKQLKGTARPDAVKLPVFPAPSSERPKALDLEEVRRQEIAEKEAQRRAELLEDLDEETQRKLEKDWAVEDKLDYRPDPDDVEVEVYPIQEPFSYIQIVRNTRTHEMIYHAIEPRLSRDEQFLLRFIEETLVDVLDLQPGELEKKELDEYIRGKFDEVLFDYSISLGDEESEADESRERLLYYVLRDFIGEGPINILINDEMIEDISCDGPHVPIFVYHRKYEALTTTVRYSGHESLDSFVIRLAQRAGKHVSIAEPILDATMRDGSRLQATLAKEVSSFGSTFTIRKFREVPFTPIDLVRFGTMSSSMLAYLWMVIEHHMSAMYAGGTASGKTTAINAIMMFIPPQNKVVTIEDTRELRVPQPNWIAGITRDGFGPRDAHGRQAGEIDMFQLLKNALRQRPDYIIVGEVRGAEAYNLFQAMATGHAAYGTMHADSVDAVIHRLESDPINIPRSLLEALDVVAVQIQTRVAEKRVRRTKQITEIVGLDPNTREILTNEVFHWDPETDSFIYSGISYVLERIAVETGKSPKHVAQEMEDRVRLINHMMDMDLRDYHKIASILTNYFKVKDDVMAIVDSGASWD